MLSIAHGTTGAFIVSKIPNLYISIPLCIAAHFVEDFIPHWDVGTGISRKLKPKKKAFLQELFFDFPLSIVLVYFIFQYNQPFHLGIWIGWFAGLFPDFLNFPKVFLGYDPWPLKHINDFHKAIHQSFSGKISGFIPQLALILIFYLFR